MRLREGHGEVSKIQNRAATAGPFLAVPFSSGKREPAEADSRQLHAENSATFRMSKTQISDGSDSKIRGGRGAFPISAGCPGRCSDAIAGLRSVSRGLQVHKAPDFRLHLRSIPEKPPGVRESRDQWSAFRMIE